MTIADDVPVGADVERSTGDDNPRKRDTVRGGGSTNSVRIVGDASCCAIEIGEEAVNDDDGEIFGE